MLSGAESDVQVTDRSISGIHPRQKKSLPATWQSTNKYDIKKYLSMLEPPGQLFNPTVLPEIYCFENTLILQFFVFSKNILVVRKHLILKINSNETLSNSSEISIFEYHLRL